MPILSTLLHIGGRQKTGGKDQLGPITPKL